jgi:hypothetical protein
MLHFGRFKVEFRYSSKTVRLLHTAAAASDTITATEQIVFLCRSSEL